MIKTVELHNFQGHRNTSLNLHPGVNVIKGQSHSGKTSIIRAIRWALANKPDGDFFRNWDVDDKSEIRVAVEFDDCFVIRTRDKKRNGYKLPQGVELNAIGRDLPQEVSNLTRMNDLNLQSQHDTYFMLQDSASAALQRLNEVVGLQIIGDTLKEAGRKSSSISHVLRSTEERIKELAEEITSLAYLDFAGKIIDKIDESLIDRASKTMERTTLHKLLLGVEALKDEIATCEEFLESEAVYEEAKTIAKNIRTVKYKLSELQDAQTNIAKLRKQISKCDERMKHTEEVSSLLLEFDKIKTLRSERVSLEALCRSIRKHSQQRDSAAEELVQAQNKHDQILSELGICPLCGRHETCPHCGEKV